VQVHLDECYRLILNKTIGENMQFGSKDFFEYYEAAHQNSVNCYLHHFAHSLAVVGVIMLAFEPFIGLALIAAAFCLSWTGHYLFEQNTPAFFETDNLECMGESVSHHIKVAVGGVVWTFASFLHLFRQGPLAKTQKSPVRTISAVQVHSDERCRMSQTSWAERLVQLMSASRRWGLPVLAILLAGYLVWHWSESLGGPAGISHRFGTIAPLVSIPVHLLLSATPFPSETIGVANGALYGLWAGTLFGWIAWWGGSIVEYGIARRSIGSESEAQSIRLPRWLQRVPASNPLFLIVGRLLPFGYHAVNIAAGIKHVSLKRHALCSAVANLIYAFAMSAAGVGLTSV
jgi:uncharacterized membrane protein YdjX (TVP38/TMEM64 family)